MSTTVTEYGPGGFDPSKPNGNVIGTREVALPADVVNRDALQDRALQALAANRGFLAVPNPTAAQNAAQVKALTRQMSALARLVLGQLDATD